MSCYYRECVSTLYDIVGLTPNNLAAPLTIVYIIQIHDNYLTPRSSMGLLKCSLVSSAYFSCALRGGGKSRAWYTLSAHAPNHNLIIILS